MRHSTIFPISALILAAVFACPLQASEHMSPPAFSDIDANGDGVIDAEEFGQHQAARMAERHGGKAGQGKGKGDGKGKGMGHGQGSGKGHGSPPAYGELDLDGNGCIDATEFAQHVAERHGTAPDSN